jgi:hypothetical protein
MTLEEIKQAKETWIKFEDHGDTKFLQECNIISAKDSQGISQYIFTLLGIIRTKDWKHFEITNNFDLVPASILEYYEQALNTIINKLK